MPAKNESAQKKPKRAYGRSLGDLWLDGEHVWWIGKLAKPDWFGMGIRAFEWLEIGFGWLLSLLLVGTWTGIIKRD